jgi:hypothetical protein
VVVNAHDAAGNQCTGNPWAVFPYPGWSDCGTQDALTVTVYSACDLNQDKTVGVDDVQLAVNMALGVIPCTADLDGDKDCDVVEVQRVINASFPGGQCVVGP